MISYFGGLGGGAARAMAQRDQARTAPRREVTEEEFRQAAKAAGWKDGEIDLQLRVNVTMGANTLVGDEMLSVKKK